VRQLSRRSSKLSNCSVKGTQRHDSRVAFGTCVVEGPEKTISEGE
jgi:hypothetical protein